MVTRPATADPTPWLVQFKCPGPGDLGGKAPPAPRARIFQDTQQLNSAPRSGRDGRIGRVERGAHRGRGADVEYSDQSIALDQHPVARDARVTVPSLTWDEQLPRALACAAASAGDRYSGRRARVRDPRDDRNSGAPPPIRRAPVAVQRKPASPDVPVVTSKCSGRASAKSRRCNTASGHNELCEFWTATRRHRAAARAVVKDAASVGVRERGAMSDG